MAHRRGHKRENIDPALRPPHAPPVRNNGGIAPDVNLRAMRAAPATPLGGPAPAQQISGRPNLDPRLTDPGQVEGLAQQFLDDPNAHPAQFRALIPAAQQAVDAQRATAGTAVAGGLGRQTQFLAGATGAGDLFPNSPNALVSDDTRRQLEALRGTAAPADNRGFAARVAGQGRSVADERDAVARAQERASL